MASHHAVIAIDGPAASGKSSVARSLAGELGFAYVNSGSLYRAVAWLVNERSIVPEDAHAVTALLKQTPFHFGLQDNASVISVDGINPEPYLRSEAVNRAVSRVSTLRVVREFLLEPLRAYAEQANLIMEGRDIGSTVFPDTPYKFYIDASPEVRAQRRAAQGQQDDLAFRDRLDASRASSPLAIAPDAHVVDTSRLSINEVVESVLELLRAKGLRWTHNDDHA
ncbi:MAG: (d)CMP kinase [Verrucomicrobia bacterium]|nr:(d)CMP kinase [Verrucomicrobiota bacterium]